MGYPVKTTVINTFKDPISRLVWFLVVVLLFALGAYWWWLLNEHNNQLSYAEVSCSSVLSKYPMR